MRIPRMCRVGLAVCCTLAGWFALWRVMSSPQTTGLPEAMLLIGGWGLGVLPIQVVPYEQRVTWARLSADWRSRGRAKRRPVSHRYAAGAEPGWQRGHQ